MNVSQAKNWYMNFMFKDGYITNTKTGQVVDAGNRAFEGATVSVQYKNNSVQQRWKIVYVDNASKERTEGFNEQFGFHINRPFYIRSRLPMKRIAECVGANNVILRRWRNNAAAQQWYFDGVSKTVKNNNWKSHSLDIQSNGGSNNLRCTTTNARWW
jgi:hypothetical protein